MPHPTTSRSALRIVILEDHVLFAESLELALTVEGYDVRRVLIPEKEQAPGALLTTVRRQHPRIALVDLDLGHFGGGEKLIAPLAAAGINVVVVTASIDRARWGEAVRLGARKVLPKSGPLNDTLATVRRINQGLQVMTREERESLLASWVAERSHLVELEARLEQLTVREREVLAHLTLGRTVREIAAVGVVSEATVRTQVKSILAKLDVTSQIAAVGLAHRVGWRAPQLGDSHANGLAPAMVARRPIG
jgi:two-component system nitrate/nitrite response regulator NarL